LSVLATIAAASTPSMTVLSSSRKMMKITSSTAQTKRMVSG